MEDKQEITKLHLDKIRIEGELRLKQAELDLRREELQVRLKEAELASSRRELQVKTKDEKKSSIGNSPLSLAIITGIISLIAAAVISLLQSQASLRIEQKKFEFAQEQEKQKNVGESQLERQRFESMLVLKAIETGKPTEAAKNLRFLVDVGYIKDPTGKIIEYTSNPDKTPFLRLTSSRVEAASLQLSPGKMR